MLINFKIKFNITQTNSRIMAESGLCGGMSGAKEPTQEEQAVADSVKNAA